MKKILNFISVILVLCLIASIFFAFHFMPGSKINNIDVSLLNAKNAIKKIQTEPKAKITLCENGNAIKEINVEDYVDFAYDENTISNCLECNRYYIVDEKINFPYEINTDKLCTDLAQINNNRTESKNAQIKFDDKTYSFFIENEVIEDEVDINKLLSAIKSNILSDKSIELSEYYKKPAITSKNETLLKDVDNFNNIYSTTITYELLDGETLTIDKATFGDWINMSVNGMSFDENKISQFVEELSKKCNTVGNTRTFDTFSGPKTIIGGTYGWKVDKDAEIRQIEDDIRSKTNIARRPCFAQTAQNYSVDDIGDTYIEVDIDNQHMYLVKNGETALETDVVTGMLSNKNRHTSTGTYFVFQMDKSRYLNGPTWHTFVNRFMPFCGGEGFHDATWRSRFGGEIYKTDGSHGCVNMPKQKALELFDNIYVGIPVIIYCSSY